MFADQSSDAELEAARYENDMHLKSRFEAIFEKYSHDFTGVGDEIDIMTGELVVDNGHLEAMASETDTGAAAANSGPSSATATGKSILRAMTVATDPADSYFDQEGADDVIMSIETIAENAAISADEEDLEEAESEDDLFMPAAAGSGHTSMTLPNTVDPDGVHMADSGDTSDCDSLFEVRHAPRFSSPRFSSPDSMFETHTPTSADKCEVMDDPKTTPGPKFSLLDDVSDENAILAKFGQSVGQEVLSLLEKRSSMAEAHIEPAWRLPVHIPPARVSSHSASLSMTPSQGPESSQVGEKSQSLPHSESLWKPVRFRKSRNTARPDRTLREIRQESEDPLQEGFSSGPDQNAVDPSPARTPVPMVEGDDEERDEDGQMTAEDTSTDEDDFQGLLTRGTCPYCSTTFKTKSGVMAHWKRLLRKSQQSSYSDQVHDIRYIRAIHSGKPNRQRGPRLTLYDFRTMVELHEGGGLSFEEIADSGALRTHKTGSQLQDVYDKHRSPPGRESSPAPAETWTEEENKMLQDLCSNPLVTLATLTRHLKGRSETDVGDKLAEGWLIELRRTQQSLALSTDAASLRSPAVLTEHAAEGCRGPRNSTGDDDPWLSFIKTEDSDHSECVRRC